MFSVQIYSMQDARFYDDASTNKVSSYIRRLGSDSLTYDDNGYYQATQSNTGDWLSFSLTDSLSTSENWSFEAKINQTNISSNLFRSLNLVQKSDSNNHISLCLYGAGFGSYEYGSPSGWIIPMDSSVSSTGNKWYRLKCELVNGTITITIYDENDNEIYSKSGSLPSDYQNIEVYPCFGGYFRNTVRQFKDILLKPL